MANTNNPSVKQYVDYANQQVDEQAILDKYNAATAAQFAVQREQNRQAENNFYNQMYNSQKTAMDTIRQSNAAAVSSGASRGVQAANELSALLGLQSESVASATELAQANRQVAQEETAAMLENVLNAYQQAQQERSQLVQQGIESASVDVQREEAQATTQATIQGQELDKTRLTTEAAENGTATYLQQVGDKYTNGVASPESIASITVALNNIGKTKDSEALSFNWEDWKGERTSPTAKVNTMLTNLKTICDAYGLDSAAYADLFSAFEDLGTNATVSGWGSSGDKKANWEKFELGNASARRDYADHMNKAYAFIKDKIFEDYKNGANRKS